MSPKQITLTSIVTYCQKEWIYLKKRTREEFLKSLPPEHPGTCICATCLYICHKSLHKHSHVSPASFFLGWIWLKFDDKEDAWKIIEKIWLSDSSPHAKRRLSDLDLIGIRPGKIDDNEKFPRNAKRNAKYVIEARRFKLKNAALIQYKRERYYRWIFLRESGRMFRDEKSYGERIHNILSTEGEMPLRDLQRRLHKKNSALIHLTNLCGKDSGIETKVGNKSRVILGIQKGSTFKYPLDEFRRQVKEDIVPAMSFQGQSTNKRDLKRKSPPSIQNIKTVSP